MALLLSALQVAAKAQAEVIIILGAGVVASEMGLLTATAVHSLAGPLPCRAMQCPTSCTAGNAPSGGERTERCVDTCVASPDLRVLAANPYGALQ